MIPNELIKFWFNIEGGLNTSIRRFWHDDCIVAYRKILDTYFILISVSESNRYRHKAYQISQYLGKGREISLKRFFDIYDEKGVKSKKWAARNKLKETRMFIVARSI